MRLCRFRYQGQAQVGFYQDETVVPLTLAGEIVGVGVPQGDSLIDLLPGGESRPAALAVQQRIQSLMDEERQEFTLPIEDVELLVPIAAPSKLLLLAGNYPKHVEERGGIAEERARTFPYVFMKPPSTTLTDPGKPVRIPKCSPDQIDWELELGVIISRRCHAVSEANALDYVAGYTVVNDISDRAFRPSPERTTRDRDKFFDWLHGKWHDTFCPMGPAVLPADEVSDPQTFDMRLSVNGEVQQAGTTGDMVFPVAAIIEFISSFVTLEPGDIISTGTPAGVGAAKNKFLRPGDVMLAQIEGIGTLRSPVE